MHDKDKIIIMSKMAVYDKRDFQRDSKANHYFRHDFIYKKNMRMRFFLGLGCFILVIFYVLYLLSVAQVDIFTLNFQFEALRILVFTLLVMVGYTFIGTIIYTREFVVAQKRINRYFALMSELDKRNEARDKQQVAKDADNIKRALDEEDEIFEKFEPYRRRGGANGNPPQFRPRSTDDPEFWDEEEK